MKKIFGIAAITVLFCAAAVFAAGPEAAQSAPADKEYVVQSVTGSVQFESAPNVWTKLEKGTKLAPSTVVKTNLNSALIVLQDGKKFSIKPMQKDSIEKLCAAIASANKTGIKVGSKVATSDVNSSTTKSRSSVSTASSRADSAEETVEFESGSSSSGN